jgi:hypothetical protein
MEASLFKILPVIYRDRGFMSQPFAFGGEDGPEAFDANIRYRSGLQNYLIDTGDEVVLVDTGIPAGTPLNAGKIAELSGLDRKVVDKAMAELKKTGAIVSPVRCKWEPAK